MYQGDSSWAPELVELRLDAFKSFRGGSLPLKGATILIGRNSSGKSNALDGLEVLARLATGEEISNALDGRRREGGPIRGGSAGCAPHGEDAFGLGCTVRVGSDEYRYDVRVAVKPDLRIIEESLSGPVMAEKSGNVSQGSVFRAGPVTDGPGIPVQVHNGRKGRNETTVVRDSCLVLSQIPSLVAGANPVEEFVLRAVQGVSAALRGVFHLDPVPHLMRDYVASQDSGLRRTGENLSAALCKLQVSDPDVFEHIVDLMRQISDDRVEGVDFVTSDLGDVMLALQETRGKPAAAMRTPARQMSDGLLRFTAVATALLTADHGLDLDESVVGPPSASERIAAGGVLIVLEEIENGLHSSQAQRVLELVRESVHTPDVKVLVTTHSPALLDAAEGHLNDSVVVCHRDEETGHSVLTPLKELPDYAGALAQHSLGDAVTAGQLVEPAAEEPDTSEFLRLLGIT